jgi:hypothetical protein
MANPTIKIKRGATAPSATLNAGEFAVDQVAKNLYLGVEVGGVVSNEIVGGSGTFATKTYVDSAVSAGTGSLGTMSTQNAVAVAITGGAINGTTIGATTASTGAFTTLTASSAPSASNDVVRKTDLDTAISDLGSVFHYVGDVSAYTDDSNPFELANIVDQSTGAYYRVDVAGTYTAGVGPSMEAKVGDAFVKTTTGWQKLDNVDVVVTGTTDEITVTGDENNGYVVSLTTGTDGSWKDGVDDSITDLETKTQNITATANITTVAGVMQNGDGSNAVDFGNGNLTFSGSQDFGTVFVNGLLEVGGNALIGYGPNGGNLEVGGTALIEGNATFEGNLVGTSTGSSPSQITDFIIDGGVY